MTKIFRSLSLMVCLSIGVAVFNSGCATNRTHHSKGARIDDQTIGAKVQSDLRGEPELKGLAVKTEVNNGEVRLSGFVDTKAQKDRTEEIARAVAGVQWVKNDLVVK